MAIEANAHSVPICHRFPEAHTANHETSHLATPSLGGSIREKQTKIIKWTRRLVVILVFYPWHVLLDDHLDTGSILDTEAVATGREGAYHDFHARSQEPEGRD